MVVEGTLGHVGAVQDVVQVDIAEARLVEDFDSGIDDLLLGHLRTNLHEFKSMPRVPSAIVTFASRRIGNGPISLVRLG